MQTEVEDPVIGMDEKSILIDPQSPSKPVRAKTVTENPVKAQYLKAKPKAVR